MILEYRHEIWINQCKFLSLKRKIVGVNQRVWSLEIDRFNDSIM